MNFNFSLSLMAALLAFSLVSQAGQVRKLELTEDSPATVILALGRTTAISFLSRPEKVVPGSPQAVQINFLGSDLTVTPVGRKPGNLLVYTKSGRYVILFSIGTDVHYDDVVKVGTHSLSRPIRLLTDSFHLASLKVVITPHNVGVAGNTRKEITVQLTTSGREMSGSDLDELANDPGITGAGGVPKATLHCAGCLVRVLPASIRIACLKPIEKIHCESRLASIELERSTP